MAGHDSRAPVGGEPQPIQPGEPIDGFTRPPRIFAAHRPSGAAMLLGATVVALIWANSCWAETYHALLAVQVSTGSGTFELSGAGLAFVGTSLEAVAKVRTLLRTAGLALAGLAIVAFSSAETHGRES